MAILYEAVIPINPRTKKNSMQIVMNHKTGRPFVTQSSKYKEYEKNCGYFLKKLPKPICEPVNVKCVFYRETRIRCDLVNLENAILDILTSFGILADDNRDIVYSMDGSRVFYDKDAPRTEITIESMGGVDVWKKF